jgi:hypothetical protein
MALVAVTAAPAFCTDAPLPKSRQETVSADYIPVSHNVGRIVLSVPSSVAGGGVDSREVCSAIAISDQLILTARHCFYEPDGGKTQYTAGYFVAGPAGEDLYEFSHEPKDENVSDDFVVLESKTTISAFSAATFGSVPKDEPLSENESLFILHFPGPGSMVLTRMNCLLANPGTVAHQLHHTCDTAQGSSGAPIFDNKFRLVGIHQEGGLTGDPKSYNVGTTLAAIMSESFQVLKASQAWQFAQSPPSGPIQLEYKTNFNSFFRKQDDAWSYRTGPDGDASVVVEQSNATGYWQFWRVDTDQTFRFPVAGGPVELKSNPTKPWVTVGTAKRTQ